MDDFNKYNGFIISCICSHFNKYYFSVYDNTGRFITHLPYYLVYFLRFEEQIEIINDYKDIKLLKLSKTIKNTNKQPKYLIVPEWLYRGYLYDKNIAIIKVIGDRTNIQPKRYELKIVKGTNILYRLYDNLHTIHILFVRGKYNETKVIEHLHCGYVNDDNISELLLKLELFLIQKNKFFYKKAKS